MAFIRSEFRGIGGHNRGFNGGQRYSYVNTADTLATIKASGYFDPLANALGGNDLIDLVGSDGAETVKVVNHPIPVTVASSNLAALIGQTADVSSIQGGLPITVPVWVVGTVGSAGDSTTLPAASSPQVVYITNTSATSMDVFPALGDSINALGVNVALAHAATVTKLFISDGGTTWRSISGP